MVSDAMVEAALDAFTGSIEAMCRCEFCVRRMKTALTAALAAAEVPEGWIIARYEHPELGVIDWDKNGWHVGRYIDGEVFITWDTRVMPTARDAMAALEKNNAKIPQ